MPDDSAKKDDKATKANDAAKKTDGAEKPISDEDAQAISGGLASIKWDKK